MMTKNVTCYCGLPEPFDWCCRPYILGVNRPDSAVQLMRSRYSAYVTGNVSYLFETTHPDTRPSHFLESVLAWIAQVQSWDGLEIVSVGENWVLFRAYFTQNGQPQCLEEKSYFEYVSGRWMYQYGR